MLIAFAFLNMVQCSQNFFHVISQFKKKSETQRAQPLDTSQQAPYTKMVGGYNWASIKRNIEQEPILAETPLSHQDVLTSQTNSTK